MASDEEASSVTTRTARRIILEGLFPLETVVDNNDSISEIDEETGASKSLETMPESNVDRLCAICLERLGELSLSA